MKKLALLVGIAAALCLGRPAYAQGVFADVPQGHWAYDAVNELAAHGIFTGYPDQTFGGKRALTRYEFAVAIQRMLQDVQHRIDAIPKATPVDTSNLATKAEVQELRDRVARLEEEQRRLRGDVDTLQRLINEFRDALEALGADVDQLKRDVAALAARLGRVEEAIAKMPKITATVTTGYYGSRLNEGDVGKFSPNSPLQPTDIDGRKIALDHNVLQSGFAVYDVDLGIEGQLSDVATAKVLLNAGNYLKGYLNDSISTVKDFGDTSFDEVTIYYAYLNTPIKLGVGSGADITVGKFGQQFTPYTLQMFNVDSYLPNDKTLSGDYPMLGGRLNVKLGSFNVQAYAAKSQEISYGDLTSTVGQRLPPFLSTNGPEFIGNPNRIAFPAPASAGMIDQSAGARLSWGKYSFAGGKFDITGGGATFIEAVSSKDPGNFRELQVYGGNLGLRFFKSINIEAEYDQSKWKNNLGQKTSEFARGSTADNSALDVRWNFGLGKFLHLPSSFNNLYVRSFYKKIGINYDAPGAWDKIGRWDNPRGVSGPGIVIQSPLPFLRMTFLGSWVDYHLFLEDLDPLNYHLQDIKAGFQFPLTGRNSVDLGYERAAYIPNGGGSTSERYINLGVGHTFSNTTTFKILYQIINFDAGNRIAPNQSYQGNVLASEFQVRF